MLNFNYNHCVIISAMDLQMNVVFQSEGICDQSSYGHLHFKIMFVECNEKKIHVTLRTVTPVIVFNTSVETGTIYVMTLFFFKTVTTQIDAVLSKLTSTAFYKIH